MRPDMAKVVTEAPRRGSSNPSKKTAKRLSKDELNLDDHGTARAPVSRHRQYGWNAKEFSDVLGPLRKYLRKQVGRPWNKVYSDLNQTLDRRSLTGLHIWDHIKQEVQLNCEEKDGVILSPYRRYYSDFKDVEVTGLYVHPRTKLLCYKPRKRYRFNSAKYDLGRKLTKFDLKIPEHYKPEDWRIIDELNVLQRVDGVWFKHIFKSLNPHDVVFVKTINGREYNVTRAEMKDAKMKIRIAVRQLSKKEIREINLELSNPKR